MVIGVLYQNSFGIFYCVLCKKRYNTATMKLEAQKRDADISVTTVREGGSIPAVCYGPDMESTAISINEREFIQLTHKASSSTIVDLDIEGEAHEVLIKEIDRHPVSENILHVDFYAIKRGAEMEINIPLEFVGEAPAAAEGAVITEVMYELPVSCRPRNLVDYIEVDLSALTEIGSHITVADITIPEGITPTVDMEDTIALASAPVEETEEDEEGGSAEEMAEVLADSSEEGEEEEQS